MTVADTAAVKTAIESVGSSAYTGHVFVTTAPDTLPVWAASSPATGYPYVLIHPAEGADEQSRATGPRLTSHPEFTLHIVGQSATSVQTVLELVKAKFVVNGFATAPTVSGRKNQRAYWRQPIAIQTDKSVTPWLLFAVVELGWESDPG